MHFDYFNNRKDENYDIKSRMRKAGREEIDGIVDMAVSCPAVDVPVGRSRQALESQEEYAD
jgi:hypothetical protein